MIFNLSEEDAFLYFNLALLNLRRDIAMLGFLHKCNLPDAHPHMLQLFPKVGFQVGGNHTKQLGHIMALHRGELFQFELLKRSVLHLVHVYNALPQYAVNARSVRDFQAVLTKVARQMVQRHLAQWKTFLAAREWEFQNQEEWKTFFHV